MAFIKNLRDIKDLCRICLISSDNMTPLDSKLDDNSVDSPQIIHALENTLMVKVDDDVSYPGEICRMCHGNLRILCDLKILYNKSQNILKKYISSLHQFQTLDHLDDKFVLPLNENTVSTSDVIDQDDTNTNEPENNVNEVQNCLQDLPKKNVKLKIDFNKQSSVKVKWLEGNRFVIEKNENKSISTTKCRNCHKIFTSKEKYSSHLNICKRYICKYCKNKFYSERSLRRHLKLEHISDPPLDIKCELCDETFKNYNARSYHKVTRHNTEGKKYTCEMCGKAFYFKNSLNQHLECHSRDVSRVVCPICGKSFHYRGGLFYHMKIHRNERNYICSFCNGRFLNMASLKRHTRIHTGERPYTCSFCPKTFCSVSEVRTHERRHTGQKPHKCKYCKKCFITPYNLKLHTSSHTGSEPCNICGKSYLNEEVLKYHLEMKHNIKDHISEEIRVKSDFKMHVAFSTNGTSGPLEDLEDEPD